MGKGFELGDYVEVHERIEWFLAKYPEGSLQAEVIPSPEGTIYVRAFAYRSPTDERPGTGLASEPVPGRTPYTKESELMNAETSAWGRALAALGAPTKGHIASAAEVRNRKSSGSVSTEVERLSSAPSADPDSTSATKPTKREGGASGGEAGAPPTCDHKDGSMTDLKLDGKPLPKSWQRYTCCNKLVRGEDVL